MFNRCSPYNFHYILNCGSIIFIQHLYYKVFGYKPNLKCKFSIKFIDSKPSKRRGHSILNSLIKFFLQNTDFE